jgi:hypothetical protein
MKVSQHLEAFHKAAVQHHTQMVQAHEKVMEKIAGEEEGAPHVSFHKSAAASHQQMLDFHSAALEDCAKVIADSLHKADMDMIVPDRVSAFPREFSTTVTPVLRAGQPHIEKSVAPEFEHLVSIED